MTPIRFTLQSTALLLPVILGGCVQSSVYVGEIAPLDQGIAIADGERGKTYTVNAGDDLTVRFYYNPQLDEDVRVRPDGSISLSLIGEIPAAGKTPAELSEQITSDYAEFLTKPKAVVIMRNFARARAFVAGEVFRPGMLSLAQGNQTVAQAIASSGGVTEAADLNTVLLLRHDPNQPLPIVLSLDIAAAIGGKDPKLDLPLLPDDLIYVPKSGAANVNTAMRLYILNNLAFGQTGLGLAIK